jgi:hypothetical protein
MSLCGGISAVVKEKFKEMIMKKLLVLFLVFGMASVANAALSAEVFESDGTTPYTGRNLSPSDNLVIKVSNTGQELLTSGSAGLWIEGADDMSEGTLSGRGWDAGTQDWAASRTANTGSLGRVKTADGGSYQGFSFFSGPLGETAAGLWYEIDFHCDGVTGSPEPDVIAVNLYNDAASLLQTITINQIPEPMTLTLLGLGGLGLLRRRR